MGCSSLELVKMELMFGSMNVDEENSGKLRPVSPAGPACQQLQSCKLDYHSTAPLNAKGTHRDMIN
jgi:hypothetical protein